MTSAASNNHEYDLYDEEKQLTSVNISSYGTNNSNKNNIVTTADRQSKSNFYKITLKGNYTEFWFEWDIYAPCHESITIVIDGTTPDTPVDPRRASDLSKEISIYYERESANKLFSIAEILKQYEEKECPAHFNVHAFGHSVKISIESISQHEFAQFKLKLELKEKKLCAENICWMTCAIESLSISETMQTAIAMCNLKLKVKLYWIETETETENDEHKSEKEQKTSIPPKYTPTLQFVNAIENSNVAPVPEVKAVQIKNFFNLDSKTNTETETPASILLSEEWDLFEKQQRVRKNNAVIKFYYKEIVCRKVVNESFQSQAFPFDCQDIPIVMRLSSAYARSGVKPKLCPGVMHREWLSVDKSVSNMRSWYLRNVSVEFNNYSESGECCVLIKVSRNWVPVSLGIMLIYFSVAFLSLTTFALASSAGRLTACVTLILSIIMFSKPALPFVTFIDKYFFITFAILVLVAVQSVFSTNPLLLSSQSIIAIVYVLLVLIIQVTILVSALYTAYIERKKIHMTSRQIQKLEHNEFMKMESIDACTNNDCAQIRRDYQFFQVDNVTKEVPGRKDWNKPAWAFAYEWYVFGVVCFLQITIGILQLIHYSSGCSSSIASANVGSAQIYVYIGISCACLIILLFAYAAFGFTKLFANVIKSVLHVLTSVNLVISFNLLAFWIHGTIACASGQIPLRSIQLPLLIVNVVLVGIFSLWVPLFASSVRDKLGVGIYLAFLYFVWMAFGILQLVNVPLLSNECLSDSYILPVTLIESVIVVIVPITSLLVLFLGFNVVAELETKRNVLGPLITLGITFVLSVLIGYAMCLHCLVFWTQSSLVCIQPAFYYPMLILATTVAGIPVWTGIFYVMYERFAYVVRRKLRLCLKARKK